MPSKPLPDLNIYIPRTVKLTIFGQLWSMKNSRVPLKSNPYKTIPNSKARQFAADFALQVGKGARLGLGSKSKPLRATVSVWYPSWRQDLDASYVYDLLQKNGVVANDRWIREKHEYAEIDAANPRVEIDLEEI